LLNTLIFLSVVLSPNWLDQAKELQKNIPVDKIAHFGLSATLTAVPILCFKLYEPKTEEEVSVVMAIGFSVFALGLVKELYDQKYGSGMDQYDLLADFLGSGLVITIILWNPLPKVWNNYKGVDYGL